MRNALLGAAQPHRGQGSFQPHRNVGIRRCPQHRFFVRSPIRRGPPHAQDVPLRSRMADAGQSLEVDPKNWTTS